LLAELFHLLMKINRRKIGPLIVWRGAGDV